jgi:hypothetical protein
LQVKADLLIELSTLRYLAGETFASLAPLLQGEELAYAVAAAELLNEKDSRAHVRGGVAARAVVRSLTRDDHRAEALAALAPYVIGDQRQHVLSRVLAAARTSAKTLDAGYHGEILATIAPMLSRKEISEALTICHRVGDGAERASLLAAIVSYLGAEERGSILRDMLTAVREERHRGQCAGTWAEIADHLDESHLDEALAAVHAAYNWSPDKYLAKLGSHLNTRQFTEALEFARKYESNKVRSRVLAVLGRLVGGLTGSEICNEAVESAQAISNDDDRTEALAQLAPHLSRQALAETFAAVLDLPKEYSRAYHMAALAPRLDDVDICKAF